MKKTLLILFSFTLFISCSKDDDNIKNEKEKIEAFVVDTLSKQYGSIGRVYTPVSFPRIDISTSTIEKSEILEMYHRHLGQGVISQNTFNATIAELKKNFTNRTYYVEHIFSTDKRWVIHYVLNDKFQILYVLSSELQ